MKINVTKTTTRTVTGTKTMDAVQALRDRAAEAIERAVATPLRSEDHMYVPEPKPLNLWEAKLCLEIAKLIQETGRRSKK